MQGKAGGGTEPDEPPRAQDRVIELTERETALIRLVRTLGYGELTITFHKGEAVAVRLTTDFNLARLEERHQSVEMLQLISRFATAEP